MRAGALVGLLVAARALQGVGAALLTPGSLAMLQASFGRVDRGRAIGAWSGLGGVATAVGPLLGGWLVEVASWRWVFLINLPLAAVVVWVALRHVPETRDPGAEGPGRLGRRRLGAVALAGAHLRASSRPGTAGPTRSCWRRSRWSSPRRRRFRWSASDGPATRAAARSVFAAAQFRAANAVTFLVYGGFGALFFLLVVQLQVVAGLRPRGRRHRRCCP